MVDTTYDTVVGMYANPSTARDAVNALLSAGYNRSQVNIIANDADERYSNYYNPDYTVTTDSDDVSGGEGTTFGAVVGALTGLAVATIPGVGPILAVGPFAAALVSGIGAATGAVTGGIAATLIDLGADESHAYTYTEFIRRGGTLVIVETNHGNVSEVEDILTDYHHLDVDTVHNHYRDAGWDGYKKDAEPWTSEEIAKERSYFDNDYDTEKRELRRYPSNESLTDRARHYGYKDYNAYEDTFHTHWSTNYATDGLDYDAYLPAYQYGYNLATMPRYHGWTWDRIETEARADWNDSFDSPWEDFKDAVHHAWDTITGDDDAYYNRYRR